MRVLHVMNGAGWGGANQMALMLCVAQRALGIDAGVCMLEGGATKERVLQADVPLYSYDPAEVSRTKLKRWADLERGYTDLLHESRPDLICTHLPLAHLLTQRIRQHERGLKWVSVFHQSWKLFGESAEVRKQPLLKYYKLLRHAVGDFLVAAKCDRVIAVSDAVRTDCLRVGISRLKVTRVFNGIVAADPNLMPDLRTSWGIARTDRIIGALGYFNANKGFDLLLRAFDSVAAQHSDVQLVAAGSDQFCDDGFRSYLEELRASSKYADRIHLLGRQRTGAEFLYNIDICAVPSRQESFSLVLAEAMQFGKPSVVTSAGGCKDVARDNLESLVFQSGNIPDLATKLERLLTDRTLASRLGKAAATRALTELTLDRCARDHIRVYTEVLGEHKAK